MWFSNKNKDKQLSDKIQNLMDKSYELGISDCISVIEYIKSKQINDSVKTILTNIIIDIKANLNNKK